MPESVDIRVRRGRKYKVRVAKVAPEPVAAPPKGGFAVVQGRRRRPQHLGEILVRFEHLGAALTTAARQGAHDQVTDLVNKWEALAFETGPFPDAVSVAEFRRRMLERAQPVTTPKRYLYSDRPLEGQGMPLGAVDITSGYNAVWSLARVRSVSDDPETPRPQKLFALQHNSDWVHAMRTPAEQLADWENLREIAFSDAPDLWEVGRRRIEALKLEKFEPYSGRLAQADLTLECKGLTQGLYVPSFIAGDQFYDWDSENQPLWETRRERPGLPDIIVPALISRGRAQGTRVMARLVPRRHEYLFAWTAVFSNIVLFLPPVFTTEVNIGVYSDILPLDWAFVGAEDDFRNSEAISRRIVRSNRYALALNQDVGSQVITLFFAKILDHRADGQWAVRAGNKTAGDLCAVLDIDRGGYDPARPDLGGRRDRHRITRKTTIQGGQRLSFGPFATQEVQPYDESGASVWANSLPFGSL